MLALRWKVLGLALLSSGLPLSALLADEPAKDRPASEAKQAAKDEGPGGIFKQLDVNGDGELTKDEIPADKKTLADRLFRNADKNNDGKLTAAEFKAGLEKQPEPTPERTPAAGPVRGGNRVPLGMLGNGEQMWKQMDRDGDGLVKPSDLPEERRERFTRIVELADTNKDGALSKEEFMKFSSRMAERGGIPGKERPAGGARPETPTKEGDRKPVVRPAGERPQARPGQRPEMRREGDKASEARRPEGERPMARPDQPNVMRREGDRPAGNRPDGRPMGNLTKGNKLSGEGLSILRLFDTDQNGRLSKSEIENAAKVLNKLDQDGDDEVTSQELMILFR